ncbi:uncharacterized protein DSM5745_08505 [Aspergillus mulundensis]|uniref:Uncharacterized protein n=1 Tax=Aspergillus mulundensis TaxID=1810919 RepID=A0A3D8R3W7_9EURO|nr:hypothetical protein DSM5745_08505 [Aspergillus mulundensis]RDW68745.1 hypothetical protein DSM5745_08505 [Aspergillus mulundensis]
MIHHYRLSVGITCSQNVGPYIPAQVVVIRNMNTNDSKWWTCVCFSRVCIHGQEFRESDFLRHIDLGRIEIDHIETFYNTLKEMRTDPEEIFILSFLCKLAARGVVKQDAVDAALDQLKVPLTKEQAKRAKTALETFRAYDGAGYPFDRDWEYLDEPLDRTKKNKWHPVGEPISFAVERLVASSDEDE